MASVIVMKGALKGEFFLLSQESDVVGRSADLSVHLPDMTVSREHLKFTYDTDGQQHIAVDLAFQTRLQRSEISHRRHAPRRHRIESNARSRPTS